MFRDFFTESQLYLRFHTLVAAAHNLPSIYPQLIPPIVQFSTHSSILLCGQTHESKLFCPHSSHLFRYSLFFFLPISYFEVFVAVVCATTNAINEAAFYAESTKLPLFAFG